MNARLGVELQFTATRELADAPAKLETNSAAEHWPAGRLVREEAGPRKNKITVRLSSLRTAKAYAQFDVPALKQVSPRVGLFAKRRCAQIVAALITVLVVSGAGMLFGTSTAASPPISEPAVPTWSSESSPPPIATMTPPYPLLSDRPPAAAASPPSCSASERSEADPVPCVRVRRELRSLSTLERERFFAALATMKATPPAAGRARYGPNFRSYDELVTIHIESVQAAPPNSSLDNHLGPAFLLYHRRFLLLFEVSLLAVDPRVIALPYWDAARDVAAGVGLEASEIWRPDWFGPLRGDPDEGYQVALGGHLNTTWRIASAPTLAPTLAHVNRHGLLRGASSVLTSRHLVRMPSVGAFPGVAASGRGCISEADFGAYHVCQEREHRCVHAFVAGTSQCVPTAQRERLGWLRERATGDYLDSAASVNDPIFFVHHANLDRKMLEWQRAHAHEARRMYLYPDAPPPGHGLHELVGPPTSPMRDAAGRPLKNGEVLLAPVDYAYEEPPPQQRYAAGLIVDCLEGPAARCAAEQA